MTPHRLAAIVLTAALAAGAAELTPQEQRGRNLYRQGTGASGEPVTAFLSGQTEVKGNVVPCAGCHGFDGRGRAEGGVVPSSVRWEDLSRPYEVTAPTGRKHAQYTERSLVRAITMGLDPAGNKLHAVMPRYALTHSDADDLIAYLKKLATDQDPGLTESTVRIGVLLPSEKRFPGMAPVVRSAIAAVFDDVNGGSGLYGRRLELVSKELPDRADQTSAAYTQFIESESIFALVSSFLAGAEEAALEAIEKRRVPLIGGWTLLPRTGVSVFFLDGGLPAQAEGLAAFGAARYGTEKAVMITSGDRLSQAAFQSARTRWSKATELRVDSPSAADAAVARLQESKTRVVLALLPAAELQALLLAAKQRGWQPVYLIPSAFATSAIMPELAPLPGPVFVASPFLPGDVNADAQTEYRRLAAAAKLSPKGFASQFTAMCEARLLIEGMKRAGRDLSREGLIKALENLYDFPAGYRQLVSFGPNRRVGVPQVHILLIEKNGGLREVTPP